MPMTPEQRVASENLQEAISSNLRANGMEGDEVLGDFVVVATGVSLDEDGEPETSYYMAFRDGYLQHHVALGLLHKAVGLIEYGERA